MPRLALRSARVWLTTVTALTVLAGGPTVSGPSILQGGRHGKRPRVVRLAHIAVSSPRQAYRLNPYPNVSHTIYAEDFEAQIPVAGGSAVVVRVVDGNDRQTD